MKRAVQLSFFAVCLIFSAGAVYNVFSDNVEVEQRARAVACGDQGASCSPQMTRMERTPFGQTFEFVTAKRTVSVRCTRGLVLAGGYACGLR